MNLRKTMLVGALTGAVAFAVDRAAAAAERGHPPRGRLLDIDGVRLHLVERGAGSAVVYLHGNGAMFEEVEATGLVDTLSGSHRLLVFDRPGFGHSTRPRAITWTPERQADLLASALQRLGISSAIVVGHSWGTLLALAMAIRFPSVVRGLVLVSGYYFPVPRSDVLLAAPALPVVGDVMRYTISPIAGWLMWDRIVAKVFAPNPVPARFTEMFPVHMALRPSQLRAVAEETGLMLPSAERLRGAYGRIGCPVTVLSGSADEIIEPSLHAHRLPTAIAQARLQMVEGVGHMLPHVAPEAVMAAVARVAAEASPAVRAVLP